MCKKNMTASFQSPDQYVNSRHAADQLEDLKMSVVECKAMENKPAGDKLLLHFPEDTSLLKLRKSMADLDRRNVFWSLKPYIMIIYF